MNYKLGGQKRLKDQVVFFLISNLFFTIFSCTHVERQNLSVAPAGYQDSVKLPNPGHMIFLWLENKDYKTLIGNDSAPYINSLIKKGTLFTNMFAITHPSYPNYVDFFAGDANGVSSDACIYNGTLSTPNLFTALEKAGRTFAWYSEDLPATGSKICTHNNYVAKHNPTTIFANVPGSANKRFADFPSDYNQLENVVCISPNLLNDMHNGTIKKCDEWIKNWLSPVIDWCATNNSIFVIYFDESDNNKDNRIPVIAVGAQVKSNFLIDTKYDHFSWTKTICYMFGAPVLWTNHLREARLITGCWK